MAGSVERLDGRARARLLIEGALADGQGALDEHQAKMLLGFYRVPVSPGQVARSEAEAWRIAHTFACPVAMKAIGPSIHHKTESGLVVLGVQGESAARMAFADLSRRAGQAFEGVLIERMVTAERELMVGMKRDPAYGPVVVFGAGGIFAEVFADIAVAIAPLEDRDATELIELTKAQKMLGAFRGYPPVDRSRLTDTLKAVGRLAIDHPEIAEIDINPLLTENGLPVAVDALVILATSHSGEPRPGHRREDMHTNLRPVFAPKRVAILGASGDVSKWGGSLVRNIVEGGYQGEVLPVNPRGGELFGWPVYTSVGDLPSTPDLAFIAVEASRVVDVVTECASKGVSAALVVSAGFSESGEEGAAAEEQVARIAEQAGMVLVGPNCIGLISNEVGLHATGLVPLHPSPGGISVVSQSGNIGYKLVKMTMGNGEGIANFVSVGNEAALTLVDVLDQLRTDPRTQVILAYLEGVVDGRHLVDVLRRTTSVKPVVVIQGGLTAAGSEAAASHTGAMASPATIREAALRQAGAIGMTSPEEGLDVALALAHLPLPRGRRVAVVTLGGGWGVLAADELVRSGLVLAELPPDLVDELGRVLPRYWSHRNPIDAVGSGDEFSIGRVLDLVIPSDAVDAMVVMGLVGGVVASLEAAVEGAERNGEGLFPRDAILVRKVAELLSSHGKPIVIVPLDPFERSVFSGIGTHAPVMVSTPKAAAQVLSSMAWYGGYVGVTEPSETS